MPITFTNKEEALEYAKAKQEDGFGVEIVRTASGNLWKAVITRRVTPKRKAIPTIKYDSEKYRLVKRTKHGTLVVIQREGNKAIIDTTSYEDMNDLIHLLDTAGINRELSQPPHLVGKGWRIEFDFSELEKIVTKEEEEEQPLLLNEKAT